MIGLSFMAALSVFAEKNTISSPDATLPLNLPMLAGKEITYYYETANKDKNALWPVSHVKTIKVGKNGKLKVEMQPMGGLVIE